MSSIYLFAAGISTIIFVLLTLISQILKNPKNPPGKTGWPIIGETLTYVSNPKKFVLERMAKHSSEIFTTSIGGDKIAVFCGPMANKCIFSNEGKLFKFWLPASINAVLGQPKVNSETKTGKPYDEFWYKFLKPESIKRCVTIVDSMVQDHLNTHWVSRGVVKVHVLAKEFMLATSLRVLIDDSGFSPAKFKELADPLILSLEGIVSAPINLPGTAYNKALTGSKLFTEKLVDVIRQRKLTLSDQQDHQDDACQDLLGGMIIDCKKNGQDLSNEDIASKIIGLIFAGFYPTSTTIAFTIAYLAENPDIYEMVLQEQQEIANSKQSEEPLTWTDVQKMQYSWSVICETLRLKPPVPGNYRAVLADFTYAGFKFLKGSKVYWTPYSTNTDPKYFHDPEKFDPQRFENSAPTPFTFVPFGSGPRMCAGKDFVQILTLVFLHHAVIRFRFERVNSNEKIVFNPDPIPSEGLPIYLMSNVK